MDTRAYDDRLYVYMAIVRIVSEHRKKSRLLSPSLSLSLSLSLSPLFFMHPPVPDRQALCHLTCKINAKAVQTSASIQPPMLVVLGHYQARQNLMA